MKTCKTCDYWVRVDGYDPICNPEDPDTYEPMERGFEVRNCKQPTQTFCESPVERDCFALSDGSNYKARLSTAEDFGCVKHSAFDDVDYSDAKWDI